jgi:diacylglycerol kinase (ATP)
MKPGDKRWVRIWKATGYTWAGLEAAWRQAAAFRQEAALVAFLTPAALWLGRSPIEQAMRIAVALRALVVELLNSAIEAAGCRAFGSL